MGVTIRFLIGDWMSFPEIGLAHALDICQKGLNHKGHSRSNKVTKGQIMIFLITIKYCKNEQFLPNFDQCTDFE